VLDTVLYADRKRNEVSNGAALGCMKVQNKIEEL